MLPADPIEPLIKVEITQNLRDAGNLARVKPGDVLTGKVIRNASSREGGLARFNGHNVPLSGASGLSAGQEVRAEVVKVALQVLLRILPGEGPTNRGAISYNQPMPRTGGGGKGFTAVLNLPDSLKDGNVLALAKPGDIISGTVVKNLGHNQSIVQIDGVDIHALSSQPLSEGQSITARVERTLPQLTLNIPQEASAPGPSPLQMQSSAFREISIRLHLNPFKGEAYALSLREGQLAEVKILQVASGGRALVEISGRQVEASVPGGVLPGDTLMMSVDSPGPEAVLQSIDPARQFNMEKAASYIRQFLPAKEPLGKILSHLTELVSEAKLPDALKSEKGLLDGIRQALRNSILSRPDAGSHDLVRRAASVSGQNYEANLKAALELGAPPEEIRRVLLKGDLKGELLKLGAAVDAKTSALSDREGSHSSSQLRELQGFGNAIRSATHQIELNQVMNAVNQREGNTTFFQLPYISGDGGMKTVDVFVQRHGKGGRSGKGKKPQGVNVTLLLDMSSLGSLRADVHIQEKSLHCKIISHQKGTRDFIEGQLPGLESSLNEMGYSTKLECQLANREKITAPVHSQKAPVEKLGILDVKV